jgi:CRP-like cAMP-binding protein
VHLRKDAKIELFKRAPLFSHCTKSQLAALAREADELSVGEGVTLTREGSRGREFVVIVEGAADVAKGGRRINRLGAGDFLGEIALISGAPRTATVTTTEPSRLLVLTDRAFRAVTRDIPAIQNSVLKALSDRLSADAF